MNYLTTLERKAETERVSGSNPVNWTNDVLVMQTLSPFLTGKTLREIGKMTLGELLNLGISYGVAKNIISIFEIAKRFCSEEKFVGELLNSSDQVFSYFHEKLRDQKKEKFFSILLDCKHRIIREDLVSIGSLNLSIVHPREVFVSAIREAAESIILVHNHPSGDPTPSKEDIFVTQRLVEVGKLVGIEVLDHIVIGDNSHVSFVEQSLM